MTPLFVLVGGWPASGKSTLAAALALELGLPYLSKDEVKEALMDALGPPRDVAASRRLGVAAVHAVLRTARTVQVPSSTAPGSTTPSHSRKAFPVFVWRFGV
jgi:predicted kinase